MRTVQKMDQSQQRFDAEQNADECSWDDGDILDSRIPRHASDEASHSSSTSRQCIDGNPAGGKAARLADRIRGGAEFSLALVAFVYW